MSKILNRFTRRASKALNTAARAIKNIHVPAYCPVDFGVHAFENNGVVVAVKNVIAMASIPIIVVFDDGECMEVIEPCISIPPKFSYVT